MKKTNYKALKVANVIINVTIALIILSTIVGITLSLTQPHIDLTNQAGNGFSLNVDIPEKLLHSPSFLSLFAVNSCLWIALLI
ncbi:DUF2975 domain-containing protein, partial [Streptococcus vicugnae]